MRDEPRRHRWFMVVLALTALATSPFPFIGSVHRSWLGLPLWLWWSGGFTVALSVLTAWGFHRFWTDDVD